MQYTYEFEMWRSEQNWCLAPFGIPGATQGSDVGDACESAADLLRETICDYLMRGEEPPAPRFGNEPERGGIRVIVSVDASLADIPRMSASQAAAALGVSRSRISTMIGAGLLDGWRDGRNTYVTIASVEARRSDPRPAGRPRADSHRPVG